MNTQSKAYMQSSEFKKRQGSFSFFRAQTLEYLVQFKKECLAGWKQLFNPTQKAINLALNLPFELFIVYTHEERKLA